MIEIPKSLCVWHVRGTVLREYGGSSAKRPINVASTVIARNATAAISVHIEHYGPDAVVHSVNRGTQDDSILIES